MTLHEPKNTKTLNSNFSKLFVFVFSSFLLFSCTKAKNELVKITGKRIAVDSTLQADPEIEAFINPFRETLESDMKEPLSYAPRDFVKNDGELQSSLGNLIADLCYEMANPVFYAKTKERIDFVMMNSGGLRAPIPKGTVTKENAFLVMPFENELVVAELTSEKTKALFDYFTKTKSAHPLSKQIKLIINENGYDVTINGVALQDGKTYKVLTNDYLQTGGDGMTFFTNPVKLTVLDYKMRDAIIDYFKQTNPLESNVDNRIIINE